MYPIILSVMLYSITQERNPHIHRTHLEHISFPDCLSQVLTIFYKTSQFPNKFLHFLQLGLTKASNICKQTHYTLVHLHTDKIVYKSCIYTRNKSTSISVHNLHLSVRYIPKSLYAQHTQSFTGMLVNLRIDLHLQLFLTLKIPSNSLHSNKTVLSLCS